MPPRIAGVNYLRAVRALERAGFIVKREGKHIIMSDGKRTAVPRNDPIKPLTMGSIAAAAGLTAERFKELL